MRKPTWRLSLLALLGFALIALIAFEVFGPKRHVQEILAKLEQIEQPTTPQALSKRYALATEGHPDRLLAWLTAIVPISTPEYMQDYEATMSVYRASGKDQTVDDFLGRQKGIIHDLTQAATDPGPVHYPFDLVAGLEMNLEVLVQLKRAAHLLSLETKSAAQHGQAERFLDSANAGLVTAATLQNSPILAAHDAYCEITSVITQSIFNGLSTVNLSKSQINRLIHTAHSSQCPNNLANALEGERAIAIDYFLEPERLPTFYRTTVASTSSRYFDLEYYLRHMQRGIAAIDQPFNGGWENIVNLQQELLENSGRKGIIGRWLCRRRVLSLLLLPNFETITEQHANARFALHVLPTALAISAFDTQQGRPPMSLDELPQTDLQSPTDFDGQPLGFTTTSNTYQISSSVLGLLKEEPRLQIEIPRGLQQSR